MPIGPGLVAASLKGWEVRVFDPNLEEDPLPALDRTIREFMPDFTGISLRNMDTTNHNDPHSYLPAFREQVRIARGAAPGAFIAAGGAAASLFSRALAAGTPGLDMIFSGEAEGLSGNELSTRAGVSAGKGPALVECGPPDGLPGTPRYDLLGVSEYRKWQDNLAVGVEVSRGCGCACTYCSYPLISGNRERYRPEDDVLEDLKLLRGRYGVGKVFLVSPLLNACPERASSLFTRIAEEVPGISWEGYFTPAGLTPELARLAERSGCTGISLSPDSGTARGMRRLGKGFGPGEVARALDAVRCTSSIRLSINLFPVVPGGPSGEGLATFARGVLWSLRAGRRISRLRFGTIRILPGTALESVIPRQDLLEPVFWFGQGRISPSGRVSVLTRLLERRLRR